MLPPFYFLWNVRYHRDEVRLNVIYKSNKWTLTALCTYYDCMWSIVQHMKHIMFSLRLLIANLCNLVTFVYTEVNLRYYTYQKSTYPKECVFLIDVWYKGSKKTRLDTFILSNDILYMKILYIER